jgi:hypothetical protein
MNIGGNFKEAYQMGDLVLIKEIIILNPPTVWVLKYKKPKYDSKAKLVTEQKFYLTNNLFYADRTSYHITSKIINESKEFLYQHLRGIPELEKMRLEFEYHKTSHIDLDNKASYWIKLMLDILKTPTPRQIENANKKKKAIITTNTIQDDNTKCIDGINLKFVLAEHKMIFRIYGRVKTEQKELDLFFK